MCFIYQLTLNRARKYITFQFIAIHKCIHIYQAIQKNIRIYFFYITFRYD